MSAPIVPWIGGKRRLADRLIPLFPPHECYVELDLNLIAREELASRGLDDRGRWVGFDRVREALLSVSNSAADGSTTRV